MTVNTDPEKVNGSCVVLFRRRDEERLFRRGDQLRQKTGGRGRPSNVDLFLGGARLPARGAFRYLGGQTGEFGDLESIVSDRERKAVIAGQMLGGCRAAESLRTREIVSDVWRRRQAPASKKTEPTRAPTSASALRAYQQPTAIWLPSLPDFWN